MEFYANEFCIKFHTQEKYMTLLLGSSAFCTPYMSFTVFQRVSPITNFISQIKIVIMPSKSQ